MKYRKKPVVIEAIQWNGDKEEVVNFVGNNVKFILGNEDGFDIPVIHTLEGDMIVRRKDYIIKGVNGEFYPCKPDIFDKTYEEVSDL